MDPSCGIDYLQAAADIHCVTHLLLLIVTYVQNCCNRWRASSAWTPPAASTTCRQQQTSRQPSASCTTTLLSPGWHWLTAWPPGPHQGAGSCGGRGCGWRTRCTSPSCATWRAGERQQHHLPYVSLDQCCVGCLRLLEAAKWMGSRMRCLSPSCAMWRAVGFVCLLSSLTLYLAVAGERFRTSSDKLQCSA